MPDTVPHTMPTPTAAAQSVRVTAETFSAWLGQAAAGDRLEYHQGFLAIDIDPTAGAELPPDQQRILREVARCGQEAFKRGLVHLVQHRVGPLRFAYLAVARRRRRAMPASPLRSVTAA